MAGVCFGKNGRNGGRPTRHHTPVDMPIADTDQADAQFDAITYAKGAASIKQLRMLLGDDAFEDGVQRYFEKYAHKNTTLKDFMDTLAEASGRNTEAWQNNGCSRVASIRYAPIGIARDEKTKKSQITRFTLKQEVLLRRA